MRKKITYENTNVYLEIKKKNFDMGMSCIIKLCLILVTVVLQTDGKPPHIIFIVADDLGEFFFYYVVHIY